MPRPARLTVVDLAGFQIHEHGLGAAIPAQRARAAALALPDPRGVGDASISGKLDCTRDEVV